MLTLLSAVIGRRHCIQRYLPLQEREYVYTPETVPLCWNAARLNLVNSFGLHRKVCDVTVFGAY